MAGKGSSCHGRTRPGLGGPELLHVNRHGKCLRPSRTRQTHTQGVRNNRERGEAPGISSVADHVNTQWTTTLDDAPPVHLNLGLSGLTGETWTRGHGAGASRCSSVNTDGHDLHG